MTPSILLDPEGIFSLASGLAMLCWLALSILFGPSGLLAFALLQALRKRRRRALPVA